ncbi:MAG: SPOR domain-containing protein [Muribaculaceae bacterium]|nr:SPOR domain-containing protein [Muribaculaceae bacterium]
MNKNIVILSALILAFTTISCKTTEKNYRTAYEVAKTGNDRTMVDASIEKKILEEEKGILTEVAGDSVRVKTEYVTIVDTQQSKDFCGVVVGSFKQIFNARSFRKRLIDKGFNSYVVQDAHQQYYVIIKGFETKELASDFIKNIKKNVQFPLPIEPFILVTPK